MSAGTLSEIRRAVSLHLTGKPYFTTLWMAMELAPVLGDADRRRILEFLASDPNEVIARGIQGPELIELTRRRAADRLAGIPLPRP